MTAYDTLMQALDEWNKAPWRRDDDDNPYTAEITLSRALRAHKEAQGLWLEGDDPLSLTIKELEAERDRLREALRGLLEIAEIHCQLLPDTPAPLDGPIGVARKALEES